MKNQHVIMIKDQSFLVDIGIECNEPAWFEATQPNTTNEDGFYALGRLVMCDGEVQDYDGVFALPACVVMAIEAEGYKVPDACCSDKALKIRMEQIAERRASLAL